MLPGNHPCSISVPSLLLVMLLLHDSLGITAPPSINWPRPYGWHTRRHRPVPKTDWVPGNQAAGLQRQKIQGHASLQRRLSCAIFRVGCKLESFDTCSVNPNTRPGLGRQVCIKGEETHRLLSDKDQLITRSPLARAASPPLFPCLSFPSHLLGLVPEPISALTPPCCSTSCFETCLCWAGPR